MDNNSRIMKELKELQDAMKNVSLYSTLYLESTPKT
jgi:hypothetical protein